jgi:hypothetical protein
LCYIRGVLEQLNHTARGTSSRTQISDGLYDLRNCQIFPVWTRERRPTFDCLRTAGSITESNAWYIADVPYLRDSFKGEAPLLAFDTSSLDDIKFLIECMECEDRRFLRLAKKESTIEGGQILDKEYTRSLRQKWKCMARYVLYLQSEDS